jgi:hypothetical protein
VVSPAMRDSVQGAFAKLSEIKPSDFVDLKGSQDEWKQWQWVCEYVQSLLRQVDFGNESLAFYSDEAALKLRNSMTDVHLHLDWRKNAGTGEAARAAPQRFNDGLKAAMSAFIPEMFYLINYNASTKYKLIENGQAKAENELNRLAGEIAGADRAQKQSVNDINSSILEAKREFKDFVKSTDVSIAALDRKSSEVEEKIREAIISAEKTALSKLQLKQSRAYWDENKSWNLAGCLGSAIISLIYLWISVKTYPSIEAFGSLQGSENITFGEMKFYPLLKVILILFVWLWIARIIIKTYLAFFTSWMDARERTVMMDTYLSLGLVGGGIPDDAKGHILQSIFRPGNNGLVKGDAMPQTPMSYVMKNVQGDKGQG